MPTFDSIYLLGLRTPRTRKKLDGSSSPRFLLLLGLFPTSKNPFARARVGHEDLRGCYMDIFGRGFLSANFRAPRS
ncbi:hypothetical protein Taro_028513 [Colocasia esculenta]|uniref:Uncharacterized protein n=1 Tax=Colocasia esculenta TaxID=4460 RepID=A0A843VS30_COLES|nr:hypothetical protein [Colocasia esculenta]